MREEVIKIRDIAGAGFVGSRYTGEILRDRIDKIIEKGEIAVLDFEGITGITQSFGDEILGIYIRAFGTDFVKKHLKFINLHPNVRQILKWVFVYSRRYNSATRERNHLPHPACNLP